MLISYFKNIKKETFQNVLLFTKKNDWKNLTFAKKLQIYGKNLNENYSLYSDKLRVKKYLKNLNIDGLNIVKLIKVIDKNHNNLHLSSLPKNCVIKTNHSWSDLIIVKDGVINKILTRGMKLENKKENYNKWKSSALQEFNPPNEQHYKHIKPEIFVEEYLGDNLEDYKFFCFHGEVKFVQVDYDRFTNHCRFFKDKNNNILPFNDIMYGHCNNEKKIVKKIPKIKEMIDIAESLSKKFEFVRVDLYNINNKIYFGEFTFVPESSNFNLKPEKYNKYVGNYWK